MTGRDNVWDCPNSLNHTPGPDGYVDWHEWAESAAATHDQQKCQTCGLYVIWNRKEKS